MSIDSRYHERICAIRTERRLPQVDRLLYILLLNLCIEHEDGSEHASVRDLNSRTLISIAAISEGIERLHATGYIVAEKRRQSRLVGEKQQPVGHELWHIHIPGLEPGQYAETTLKLDSIHVSIIMQKMNEPS